MKIKKILSIFLTIGVLLSVLSLPSPTLAKVDNASKIAPSLLKRLDTMDNEEKINVSVWFKELSEAKIEKSFLNSVFAEIEKNNLNKNVFDLLKESNLDINRNKDYNNISPKDVRKLNSIKRNINANENKNYNAKCIDTLTSSKKIEEDDIKYVDNLLPNVEMSLSKDQIYNLIDESSIESIYNCSKIQFPSVSKTGKITTNSKSSNYINSSLYQSTGIASLKENHDGSGISIGIISDKRPNLNLDAICEANIIAAKHSGENLAIDQGSSDLANYIATQLVGSIGNYEGIVPEATLYFRASDTTHWKADINYLVLSRNVDMLSLFFEGVEDSAGTYGDIAKWIDALVNHNSITVIQPVNKNSDTSEVTEPAMAYNAIAVGGASASSSISAYNNDDDLSYKPDVVAPYDMAVKYDDSSNAIIPCDTSSSAGLVTGAMALLMDAEIALITCPHLAKSVLLNGTTYYGSLNTGYSTSNTNPNPSFVAFDRATGAGQINIYNSYINYVSRHWDVGTLSANQETFSGSFYISGASKEVHVNFCAIKNNTFNGDGSAMNSSCPNITLTVQHGNKKWTSTVTTDNKCSVVFITDSNSNTSSGTYSIYLKSNISISKSALSNMVY